MKVLDLRCPQDHAFEGWFASEQDYLDQHQRNLLQCPLCGASDVRKMLSAPRINLGARVNDGSSSTPTLPSTISDACPNPDTANVAQVQAAWLQAARKMLAQAEDVGGQFADEARRIHRGEAPERTIKGNASAADAVQLLEEGIAVLPLPAVSTETLH